LFVIVDRFAFTGPARTRSKIKITMKIKSDQMIQLRLMTGDDVGLGMRLKDQAGWNQTEADWRRFLALEPEGCFVAELDGRPVGTTTTTCLSDEVGWIAMVLVDEPARHRGIGTRLVRHALEHLDRRGARTVRLDATALGRPVYERLGFEAEYELARWEGTAAGPGERVGNSQDDPAGGELLGEESMVDVSPERLDPLVVLDRRVTATNRRRLLERLVEERPDGAKLVMAGESPLGYVMVRGGSRATQIGPAVAVLAQAGRLLAGWALGRCAGGPVFVDVPCDNADATRWAASRGLSVQRRFTRMCRGRPIADLPAEIWASSGPEKG
jgi:GNAT superfamily N-acetyltransferase